MKRLIRANHKAITAGHLCPAVLLFAICLLLTGCAEIRNFYSGSGEQREAAVLCDNLRYIVSVPADAMVSDALLAAGVAVGESDIVSPAASMP